MKNILPLFLIIVCISCKVFEADPKPTADFTYSLQNEGLVSFNVSSANADSFDWDFGDGKGGTGKTTSHLYEKNGDYIVTMTAKGKGGEVTKQQSIRVNNITGSAAFYISSDPGSTIRVTLLGRSADITGYFRSGVPDCGQQYTASFSGLPEGTFSFSAEEINKLFPRKWNGSITVKVKECSKMRLTWN